MHSASIVVASLGLLLGNGCAGSLRPAAPPHPPCPLGVEDARVTIVDIEGGVAMTFTAPDSELDELRRRVRDAAAMHGPGAHASLGHGGQHGLGDGHGLRLRDLPALVARAEPVSRGERLDLVAVRRDDAEDLRAKARLRLEDLRAQECH